jgi:hypothetical protein
MWWLQYIAFLLVLSPAISAISHREIHFVSTVAGRIRIRDQSKGRLVQYFGSRSSRRRPQQEQEQQQNDWSHASATIIRIRGGNNDKNEVAPPGNSQSSNDGSSDDREMLLSSSFITNTTTITTTIDSQSISTWRDILANMRQSIFSEQRKEQWQKTLHVLQQLASRLGPTLLTVVALLNQHSRNPNDQPGVSIVTIYSLVLLGASCGFHLFLYFITLGFALGVTIPLVVSLLVYQVKTDISENGWETS